MADPATDEQPTEPTFSAERLLERPDLAGFETADVAGALHLAGVEPDAELTASDVAELVRKFHEYVPADAIPEPEVETPAEDVADDVDDSGLAKIGENQLDPTADDPWAMIPENLRDANAKDAAAALSDPPEGVTAGQLVAYEQAQHEGGRKTVLDEARKLGLLAPADDDTQES